MCIENIQDYSFTNYLMIKDLAWAVKSILADFSPSPEVKGNIVS